MSEVHDDPSEGASELYQPTDEQRALWNEWVEDLPECVSSVARYFNPWTLYEFKESGKKVTLVSFEEHAGAVTTLQVHISHEHNPVCLVERAVFGVAPDSLRRAV